MSAHCTPPLTHHTFSTSPHTYLQHLPSHITPTAPHLTHHTYSTSPHTSHLQHLPSHIIPTALPSHITPTAPPLTHTLPLMSLHDSTLDRTPTPRLTCTYLFTLSPSHLPPINSDLHLPLRYTLQGQGALMVQLQRPSVGGYHSPEISKALTPSH